MKKGIITLMAILISSTAAFGQAYIESLFGLDLPIQKWTNRTDVDYLGAPRDARVFGPTDAANLRFAAENDTTDIIMVLDEGNCQIHWIRCSADPSQRTIQRLATYGDFGHGVNQFVSPRSFAVASASPYYDPSIDYIFVGDRINHRIVRLNFDFNPGSPESDEIIWESTTFVDTDFYPVDLEYVNYGTGYLSDNRLFALDDAGNRLVVFSHDGQLLQQFDISDPTDSTFYVYWGFTHKLNPNGSVSLYLANIGDSSVRGYRYSAAGELSFVNEIFLGDRRDSHISEIIYENRIGLWAVESRGPHLYKLSLDLARVIMEIRGEELDPTSLYYLHKIRVFPERIVLFEEMGDDTGILTFAFNPPWGKKDNDKEEIIPFRFALSQNYPNPFNPNTTIRFEIPQSDWVKLEIFNILGQKVKTLVDEYKNAGGHSIIWKGTNKCGRHVATGVYFTRLSSGQKTEIKKMLLLR